MKKRPVDGSVARKGKQRAVEGTEAIEGKEGCRGYCAKQTQAFSACVLANFC
jgi:hypothetical protein